MSNFNSTQIAEQFQQREVDSVNPQLVELMREELKLMNTVMYGSLESKHEKAKNDERRREVDRLFGEMVVNHFLEILAVSETPSVFSRYSTSSLPSCKIQFRHKILEIRLILPIAKGNLDWEFYVKPLPALVTEFESWSRYLDYSDREKLNSGLLKVFTVREEFSGGREALLAVLVGIDQNYETEIAAFEELKQKAFEQQAITQKKLERVQIWNDLLDRWAHESEKKWQDLISQAQAEAWAWPSGKTITLCELTWQTGQTVEGIATFAQECWSLSSIPDEEGYFDLLPEVSSVDIKTHLEKPIIKFGKKARKTKPPLAVGITKTKITNLADLPPKLIIPQCLSLERAVLYKAECKDRGSIDFISSTVEVLPELLESEKTLMKEFSSLPSDRNWKHISLALMPIEEIRLALSV